jgi:hypothetical protein
MITQAQNDVYLAASVKDKGILEPYVVLSSHEATFITNRFNIWSKMIAIHPQLAAMCEESKSAHLAIVADWQKAISEAMQDSTVPFVVLPEKQYKAAM